MGQYELLHELKDNFDGRPSPPAGGGDGGGEGTPKGDDTGEDVTTGGGGGGMAHPRSWFPDVEASPGQNFEGDEIFPRLLMLLQLDFQLSNFSPNLWLSSGRRNFIVMGRGSDAICSICMVGLMPRTLTLLMDTTISPFMMPPLSLINLAPSPFGAIFPTAMLLSP
jgi:hypothetical protein